MDFRQNRLEAKVRAVNSAHTQASSLHAILTTVFVNLVGKKILKVDGELLAKIAAVLPELPKGTGLNIWRKRSEYSLAWGISASESYSSGFPDGEHRTSVYHETTVYVGRLDGGILAEMTEFQPQSMRTNYTATEIAIRRATAEDLKKKYDKVISDLFPFGTDDR